MHIYAPYHHPRPAKDIQRCHWRAAWPDAGEIRQTAVGLLVPLKSADPDRLAGVLARAEMLSKGRDALADDDALAAFGPVDPVDWSVEAVRALIAGRRRPDRGGARQRLRRDPGRCPRRGARDDGQSG
jgi:hypothetical protein